MEFLSNQMKAVTVAYRKVRGNAKNYSYCGAKVYQAVSRLSDGVLTWRPLYESGPDRRSTRLACEDAIELSNELKLPFIEGIRLGTVVTQH